MTITRNLIAVAPKHGGPWREEIRGRALELADQADRLADHTHDYEIAALLTAAMKAADEDVSPRSWWTGRYHEAAWTDLHAAENRLAELVPDDDAEIVARDALQHAARLLPKKDPRVLQLRADLDRVGKDGDPPDGGPHWPHPKRDAQLKASRHRRRRLRDEAVEVLRAAHIENELLYEEARTFRDRLLVMGVLSILASVGLIVVQAQLPRTPFLVQPSTSLSAWQVLALVVVFGCFGAYVSSLPALGRMSRGHSPYNLPVPQAVLKVGAGAVTAVAGVVLVSTAIANDPSSLQAVLALAVVFGAGQQAVTKSLDNRAAEIIAGMDKPKEDAATS